MSYGHTTKDNPVARVVPTTPRTASQKGNAVMLYHATPKANLDSIHQHGINPAFSTGKEKVIWYHTKSRRHWAILHTAKRHNCTLDDIAVITVEIPRSKLTRRRRGLWTTTETITPIMITDAAELAASPFD